MSYQPFQELDVWKKARILKNELKELIRTFPPEEKYRLTDQLYRSSRSICAQIAEGHGRRTFPDKLKFTLYGRGSLSETLNHLIDAFDNGYMDEATLQKWTLKVDDVEQVMNGYIRYLESQIRKK